MQKGLEASKGCFQAKSLSYGPLCLKSFRGKTEVKSTIGGKQANIVSESDGAVKYEKKLAVPIQGCGSSVQQENYDVCSALSPGFPKDVRRQSRAQSYSRDYVRQDFQYFVVIDFEATCDKEKNPHPQEIIEFPSVIVNTKTCEVEDSFQIYVRPTHNQMLTEFCKELTGIQQSQVDKGVLLTDALLMHDKWLGNKGIKQTNFAVVTWSSWDCKVILESECRYKKIRKPPYFNRWINLRVPFKKLFGEKSSSNLKGAVELAGLTWEGRAHCGLDDAKNTARLLVHLMRFGFKFSITDTLPWECAEKPTAVYQQPQIPFAESSRASQSYKGKNLPFQPYQTFDPMKERPVYCFCGFKSVKRVFEKQGPNYGRSFFGCGNWTAYNNGPACSFIKWVGAAYGSGKYGYN